MQSGSSKFLKKNNKQLPNPMISKSPKKIITKETFKTTFSQTKTLNQNEIIKTSNENNTIQIIQEFKNRPDLLKRISITNSTSQITQKINQNDGEGLQKKVRMTEETQVKQEMIDGKIKVQKRLKQNQYEEVLLNDDNDNKEIEDMGFDELEIKNNPQRSKQSQNMKIKGSLEAQNKSRVVLSQKESAPIFKKSRGSTIPVDHSKMMEKYRDETKNQASGSQGAKTKQRQNIVQNILNSPEFLRKNIIKVPYFSESDESMTS